METRYEPKAVEQRWYDAWEQRGYFKPRESLTGKTFTISMPPPNITGDLHMGHAMYTLEDVLIRWHRMLGDAALWVPGTDHAAIATQNVLEKQLARKGSSKEAIGREAWDRLVKQWYETTGHTILQQMRRVGFSADWWRIRFTMDPTYVDAIRYAFVQLWREGLIYRGPRIVNWCPRDQSAISDLEVQYEEADDELYYLDYPVEGGGLVSVATARPETMVGDTGVAVHPDDWRYKDLIGKSVTLPVVHRIVPIVADEAVDREFGTGAVKVTPGHDVTDYDIGERHHLPTLTILHLDGRMNIPEVPQLTQDPDVLDTWFSSALWPYATLGWPEDTDELRRFYPTQVLDTAREILYLWVARMVFTSLHFLNAVPFSDVLIHGTVLATDGRRMSKSLGTGVDPLDMIGRYGADATRAWCAYFGTSGQDIRFSEEKIKSYQLFANKLWNATRLLASKLPQGAPPMPIDESVLEPADTWILGRLSAVTRLVTESFQRFEFGPAIDALYEFAWHEYADDYLELIKPRLQAGDASTATAQAVAIDVLETTLRLLHPIMPFVTEELWQRLPHEGETIMYAAWPLPDETIEDRGLMEEMSHLLDVVREVRNLRQGSEQKARRLPAEVTSARRLLTEPVGRAYLATLAGLELNGKLPQDMPQSVVVVGNTTVRLGLPGDGGAEKQRHQGELQKKLREIESIEAKLNNPDFTGKAPAAVVERERTRLTQARQAAERLQTLLDS